jgi:4-carboxymuconolactone decarboxylase
VSPDDIRERYRDLVGHVPKTVETRLALAEQVHRLPAIAAIETMREELLHRNPLDRRTQQLVHLAMLIGAGEDAPARLHVAGALKAGVTPTELFGVCETAAVVGGMPAFSRAVDVVASVLKATQ